MNSRTSSPLPPPKKKKIAFKEKAVTYLNVPVFKCPQYLPVSVRPQEISLRVPDSMCL